MDRPAEPPAQSTESPWRAEYLASLLLLGQFSFTSLKHKKLYFRKTLIVLTTRYTPCSRDFNAKQMDATPTLRLTRVLLFCGRYVCYKSNSILSYSKN